jgi:hypothetical protein
VNLAACRGSLMSHGYPLESRKSQKKGARHESDSPMSIILGSGTSKSKAFSIHGVTCAVMLVVGLLLIHAI